MPAPLLSLALLLLCPSRAPQEPAAQPPAEPPGKGAVQGPEQEPGQKATMTREDFENLDEGNDSTPLPPPRPPEPRAIQELLVLGPVERPRRSPLTPDPVAARLVAEGSVSPREGDTLRAPDGTELAWRALGSEEGRYEDPALRGGWAYARVTRPEPEVQLLEARGHSALFVNGAARGGDVYSTGLVRIPFVARPDGTELLLRAGRGRLEARVTHPPAPVFVEDRDATLPDVVRGRIEMLQGMVAVVNATDQVQPDLFVTATAEFYGRHQQYLSTVRVPMLQPLEARKLKLPLPFYFEFDEADDLEEFTLIISLHQLDREALVQVALSQARFQIPIRRPDQPYQTTYVSTVDGSVQPYAVRPAAPAPDGAAAPGLVLSLHGAGVQAPSQAASYGPNSWAHVVAPTNRRPYGFDWEDWGRIDALEVLDAASARLTPDPRRTYLTGHSMGGHGAWQLGVNATNRFAAVAPSAGWCDFWSYGGAWMPAEGDAVGGMFARAANSSRTALMLENLAPRGVYVLHGDADDNVPVSEARAMRARLEAFHTDFAYHEQPGAGHWWGNECVDWPPLFEYLQEHELPPDSEVREVSLTTVNPAVSSKLHWLTLEAQHRSLEPSRLEVDLEPSARRFRVQSENVSRFSLDLAALSTGTPDRGPTLAPDQPLEVEVDGQTLSLAWPIVRPSLRLFRPEPGGPWALMPGLSSLWKSPQRAGPFKDALRNGVLFVYATGGTPEENAWSIARARYDADVWSYRGNGVAELVADAKFLAAQPHWRGEHDIVIYGHADMNLAWSTLFPTCPVEARRGWARVGERRIERDDLALLFAFPRTESATAAAAVVCGTGPVGQRLSEHLPTFVSGIGWPDWAVLTPEVLEHGSAGVLGAGFFGYDWTLDRGDSAWRQPPQRR